MKLTEHDGQLVHENGGGNAIVRPGKRQQHILVINTIPASCRNPAPGHSRCSAQARASGLAGAERFKPTREARAHAQPQAAAPSAHPAQPANHPGIMKNPGIPAQQMQRTGTRERVCRCGMGQNLLAEHAQRAPQPRSIAWGGSGEAAMKGDAPWFCRELHLPWFCRRAPVSLRSP